MRREHGFPENLIILVLSCSALAAAVKSQVSVSTSVAVAKVAPTGLHGKTEYSSKPPFSPEELWAEILALLNYRDASVTPKHFEHVFNVHFGPPKHEQDATVYSLVAGTSWYFDVRLTLYAAVSHNVPTREINNAYLTWHIDWSRSDFTMSEPHQCITAEIVRRDLLASGWTSPWPKWGAWEDARQNAIKNAVKSTRPGADELPSPSAMPEAVFRKQTDESDKWHHVLPQGRVFTVGQEGGMGDSASSCVKAIRVEANL